MDIRRYTIIQWISLSAVAFIGVQTAYILAKGEAFCLNEGCRIVEQLTLVPPLYINLAGLVYFIVLFGVSLWSGKQKGVGPEPVAMLLLLGLGVEAVLLGYQLFVIRTYCSYCLVIFGLILLLNIVYGRRQIFIGLPLLGAMIAAFGTLNFSPAALLVLRSETLDSGTYAVRKCEEPAEKLYYFFSGDCPHCKNVLAVLENCNRCEIHFNPIDRDQALHLSGLAYTGSYNPSLNRAALAMLNITTIPVMLVQNTDGLTFIRGEESIIRFVNRECFSLEQELSVDQSMPDAAQDMNLLDEEGAECTIEVECPEEPGWLQSPYSR